LGDRNFHGALRWLLRSEVGYQIKAVGPYLYSR
jgi:hypothetical protein